MACKCVLSVVLLFLLTCCGNQTEVIIEMYYVSFPRPINPAGFQSRNISRMLMYYMK